MRWRLIFIVDSAKEVTRYLQGTEFDMSLGMVKL